MDSAHKIVESCEMSGINDPSPQLEHKLPKALMLMASFSENSVHPKKKSTYPSRLNLL